MAKLHNVGAFKEKHLQVTVHHSGQVGLGIEDTRHSGRSLFVALSPSEAGWLREQISVEEQDNPEKGNPEKDVQDGEVSKDHRREVVIESLATRALQGDIEAARLYLSETRSVVF